MGYKPVQIPGLWVGSPVRVSFRFTSAGSGQCPAVNHGEGGPVPALEGLFAIQNPDQDDREKLRRRALDGTLHSTGDGIHGPDHGEDRVVQTEKWAVRALQEMGRIEKTIFLLDYVSDNALRRRVQRGLNKGESMNSLARAFFFGKRGELRERALNDQLQRASALSLLINAISVWNTVYWRNPWRCSANLPDPEPLAVTHPPSGVEPYQLSGGIQVSSGSRPRPE